MFASLHSNDSHVYIEPRLSVYGKSIQVLKHLCSSDSLSVGLMPLRVDQEWDQLAEWVVDNNMFDERVLWMVQIPRLFNLFKSAVSLTRVLG